MPTNKTPKIILSSDGMCDADEADYEAYTSYICKNIDAACGFEVEVDSADFGRAVSDREAVQAEDEAQAATIREALSDLWERFCGGGWSHELALAAISRLAVCDATSAVQETSVEVDS